MDDDLDQTGDDGSDIERAIWGDPEPEDDKKLKPKSSQHLIQQWNTEVGKAEWGSGLTVTNIRTLKSYFGRWMKSGVSFEAIEQMISLYASDPKLRNRRVLPWRDFLAKQELLYSYVKDSVQTTEREAKRHDAGYWTGKAS